MNDLVYLATQVPAVEAAGAAFAQFAVVGLIIFFIFKGVQMKTAGWLMLGICSTVCFLIVGLGLLAGKIGDGNDGARAAYTVSVISFLPFSIIMALRRRTVGWMILGTSCALIVFVPAVCGLVFFLSHKNALKPSAFDPTKPFTLEPASASKSVDAFAQLGARPVRGSEGTSFDPDNYLAETDKRRRVSFDDLPDLPASDKSLAKESSESPAQRIPDEKWWLKDRLVTPEESGGSVTQRQYIQGKLTEINERTYLVLEYYGMPKSRVSGSKLGEGARLGEEAISIEYIQALGGIQRTTLAWWNQYVFNNQRFAETDKAFLRKAVAECHRLANELERLPAGD